MDETPDDQVTVRADEAPSDSEELAAAVEPPADLGELAQGRRVVQVVATLAADASIPSVRAYMVLSTLAEQGETLACSPAPEDVETFAGTDVVAWLVSDRTDAELAEAVASIPEVAEATTTEAVPDAAVDDPQPDPAPSTGPAAEPSRQAPSRGHGGSSTVRVDAERLDQLMHAMVMQVRMIPVEAVLLRFPRLVRDLSVKLSKQVELELIGKDTELDRSVVDSLGDPLVHLIRNSLDHGLETPAERVAAGKPETGRVEIAARHAGVIIRGGGTRVAFAVSSLDGQRELVTRPLPPEVADGSALSGAAVLSDGQIALIVDCDAVAEGVA